MPPCNLSVSEDFIRSLLALLNTPQQARAFANFFATGGTLVLNGHTTQTFIGPDAIAGAITIASGVSFLSIGVEHVDISSNGTVHVNVTLTATVVRGAPVEQHAIAAEFDFSPVNCEILSAQFFAGDLSFFAGGTLSDPLANATIRVK